VKNPRTYNAPGVKWEPAGAVLTERADDLREQLTGMHELHCLLIGQAWPCYDPGT